MIRFFYRQPGYALYDDSPLASFTMKMRKACPAVRDDGFSLRRV